MAGDPRGRRAGRRGARPVVSASRVHRRRCTPARPTWSASVRGVDGRSSTQAQREDPGAHRSQPDPRDPHRARDRRGAACSACSSSKSSSWSSPCVLAGFASLRARPGAAQGRSSTCRVSRRSRPRSSRCPRRLSTAVRAGSCVAVARGHACSCARGSSWQQVVPSRAAPARAWCDDLVAGVLVQLYVTFLASVRRRAHGRRGGQWWTLAFIIHRGRGGCRRVRVPVSRFGKHKMAPEISPKKTWEGFGGARRREPRRRRAALALHARSTRGGSAGVRRGRSSSRRPSATSPSRWSSAISASRT